MAFWLGMVLAVLVGNLLFFAGGIWLLAFLGRRDDARAQKARPTEARSEDPPR
jgi:hypothetical protein